MNVVPFHPPDLAALKRASTPVRVIRQEMLEEERLLASGIRQAMRSLKKHRALIVQCLQFGCPVEPGLLKASLVTRRWRGKEQTILKVDF